MNDVASFNAALLKRMSDQGTAPPVVLERGRAVALKEKARLDQTLLRLGLVEESLIMQVLCQALGCRDVTAQPGLTLDVQTAQTLTTPYLASRVLVPLLLPDGEPLFAANDPANEELAAEVGFLLGKRITLNGATTAVIRALLAQTRDENRSELPTAQHQIERDADTLRRSEVDGPVIKFVQEKLTEAVMAGASDIHFESTETGISLRFRINGILVPQRVDSGLNPSSIFARVKVMAQANVSERRLPQDGRLEATIAGRKVDFRFSSLPTQWGESIVCRVLDPKSLRLGWAKLGFSDAIVDGIKDILSRPSGLFLVTGPTGSGKTTTLYTAVSHLNTSARKIVTVEDPIEYNLSGIQQVQVHEEIGLTFSKVLRSILRHDPNVILIGEIRDQETAEIAVRAAQVGRLVLSTLHTNSPAGAVTRMVDLGVPEFLMRDVLRGVLGQELMIEACRMCSGSGCTVCSGTGTAERRLRAQLLQGASNSL